MLDSEEAAGNISEAGSSKKTVQKAKGKSKENASSTAIKAEEISLVARCDNDEAPPSPASSSMEDVTFEPTVDMMVNDFDDEQTLNEEEALAEAEAINPQDEIAKLKEEGEMSIEELLAMYGQATATSDETRPKRKRPAKKRFVQRKRRLRESASEQRVSLETAEPNAAAIVTDVVESHNEPGDDDEDDESVCSKTAAAGSNNEPSPPANKRRSHLMALYRDGDDAFEEVPPLAVEQHEEPSLELMYGNDDADDEEYEEDTEDTEGDDKKRKIWIGATHQADIPDGLSQYGDILPYENEDKLIWEPSQVSESAVEDYLLQFHEVKPDQPEEQPASASNKSEENSDNKESVTTTTPTKSPPKESAQAGLIRDSEQALHLLVQCGYDFKEALRRTKLNALPLSANMSLWSENECLKFEEGIQEFGKDFVNIRQQHVRTRTMRELVHFYYLWKKSERRDRIFANADTTDHMDAYLNERQDNQQPTGAHIAHNACAVNASSSVGMHTRRSTGRNVSIMTTNTPNLRSNKRAAGTHGTTKKNAG